MNALVLNRGCLEAVTLPIPTLLKNQVLVRVEAAALTQADLMFVRGGFTMRRRMPAVPGIEGAGVVVKNGGSLRGWRLSGKRVAFYAVRPHEQGCWAEFIAVSAKFCVVLEERISFSEGCFLHVEPMTVLMVADKLYQTGSKAVVHTLGSSSLGMLLLRYCQANEIPCINICVKPEDKTAFKSIAASYILDPQKPKYELRLPILLYDLGARVFIDGEGGPNSSYVFERMPPESTLFILTSKSSQPIANVPVKCFTEHNKKVEGFNMPLWLTTKTVIGLKLVYRGLLDNLLVFRPKSTKEFGFEQIEEALKIVESSHSSQKFVIVPTLTGVPVSVLGRESEDNSDNSGEIVIESEAPDAEQVEGEESDEDEDEADEGEEVEGDEDEPGEEIKLNFSSGEEEEEQSDKAVFEVNEDELKPDVSSEDFQEDSREELPAPPDDAIREVSGRKSIQDIEVVRGPKPS
jgi:NADPH:quinone reductase-like Zn-dependent oxidoreductase